VFTEGPALLHRRQKAFTEHMLESLDVLLHDTGKGRKESM